MAHEQESFRLHMFTGSGEAAEAESALAEAGIEGRRLQAHGGVPLAEVLFAASAPLTSLARLITLLRHHFNRGVLVDALGTDCVVVKADGSLPRGLVVVRDFSGEIEVRDAEGIGQALVNATAAREPEPRPPTPVAPRSPGI